MQPKDVHSTPIKLGDTLEAVEPQPAVNQGDRFIVDSVLWDEDDTKESLVAISTPRPYLTINLEHGDNTRGLQVV